jgi:hypothetical protein
MKTMKSILGYTWAAMVMMIPPATFFGHTFFSTALARGTGITIHPRFSGGEIISTMDHGQYKTSLHRPVFDGLITETPEGFVQVNWEPASGLPRMLKESIDYNQDGKEDFALTLNTQTGETSLTQTNPAVLGVGKAAALRNGWAVRVLLKRHPDCIR